MRFDFTRFVGVITLALLVIYALLNMFELWGFSKNQISKLHQDILIEVESTSSTNQKEEPSLFDLF